MTKEGRGEPRAEAAEADAVEQEQEAVPGAGDGRDSELPEEVPLEADEADTAEQTREVNLDEDDYR
ncbi:MAG: hypothetical protein ACYCVZ_12445 [Streptosporangiaceae bacterium]